MYGTKEATPWPVSETRPDAIALEGLEGSAGVCRDPGTPPGGRASDAVF